MATIPDRVREKWESITPRERGMVVLLAIAFVAARLRGLTNERSFPPSEPRG